MHTWRRGILAQPLADVTAAGVQHGLEAARRYGAGQEAAKEWIASESAKLGIDCEARPRPRPR